MRGCLLSWPVGPLRFPVLCKELRQAPSPPHPKSQHVSPSGKSLLSVVVRRPQCPSLCRWRCCRATVWSTSPVAVGTPRPSASRRTTPSGPGGTGTTASWAEGAVTAARRPLRYPVCRRLRLRSSLTSSVASLQNMRWVTG